MARFTGSQYKITISPVVVHTVAQLQMALRSGTSLQAEAALGRTQVAAIDRFLKSVADDGEAHVSAQTASEVRSALESVLDHVQSRKFRYDEGDMLVALVPSIASALGLPASMGGLTSSPMMVRNNAANVMSLRDVEKEFKEISNRLAKLDAEIREYDNYAHSAEKEGRYIYSPDESYYAAVEEMKPLKAKAMQLSDKIKRMKTQEAASKSFSAGTSPFAALASRRAGVVKSEEDAAWDEHRGRDNASHDDALIADLLGTIAHIRAQLQALESSIEQHQHRALPGPATSRLMLTAADPSRTAALAKARGARAAMRAGEAPRVKKKRDNGNGDRLMLEAYLHEATQKFLPFLARKIHRDGEVSLFKQIPLADTPENAEAAVVALFGRSGKPIRLSASGAAPDMKYVKAFETLLKIALDAAEALTHFNTDNATLRGFTHKIQVQESYLKRHFNFV